MPGNTSIRSNALDIPDLSCISPSQLVADSAPSNVCLPVANKHAPLQRIGRFAPSPTGRMHAGNIFAALMVWIIERKLNGSVALRIEDIDRERSHQSYADQIMRDLEFLGLEWDKGPLYQHNRLCAYKDAYDLLESKGLCYPCFCSRADLHTASAPHRGEKTVYSGTCRNLTDAERRIKAQQHAPATRLMVDHSVISIDDRFQGSYRQELQHECGDFLIRRSDGAYAYQLASVVDDAFQNVTDIVRGCDLLCSTPQQVYLQSLLGFSHPSYAHIPLLVASHGKRLSKRNHDASMDALRSVYTSPESILGHIAFIAGLVTKDKAYSIEELVSCAHLDTLCRRIEIQWHN